MPQKGERRKFGDQIGEWDGSGWKTVTLTPDQPAPAPQPKAPTWSDRLGLNDPTDSMVGGFARGAGGAVVDMAQGAVADIRNSANKSGDPALRKILGAVPVEQAKDVMDAPDTAAGTIGGLLPTAAQMAIPTGTGAKVVHEAIPNVERAGRKFQDVMSAAKDVPVDLSEAGNVALRITQLAEHGGSMPMAVRKFLAYATDPSKPAMTYEVARDFASNISRLSADEMGRLTPVVAREVANLRVTLNKANALAAKAAGKLPEYEAAMREYANAMRVRNVINSAIEGAKKTAPYATAAGAGLWLSKKLASLID